MQRKIAIRFILGLFAIAALFFGSGFMKEFFKDPDQSAVNTTGMVAAIEVLPQGQRAVVFKPSGEKIESGDYQPGKVDQDVSWAPDGNRLYISSDRQQSSFNIYRWNPDSNKVELRSQGSRSQGVPWYGPTGFPGLAQSGLILSGGFVMEYDAKNMLTRQILPPVLRDRDTSEEGGGLSSTMETLYGHIGISFRQAYWNFDRSAIIGVMRREDGAAAFYTSMTPDSSGKMRPPLKLMVAKDIQMASDGHGAAACVVRGYFFATPQEAEDYHKVRGPGVPFLHGIFKMSTAADGNPKVDQILTLPDNKVTFADPAVSPDGKQLAVVTGKPTSDGAGMTPLGLFLVPFEQGGGLHPLGLVQGDISQPQFTPDGTHIVFIRREDGKGTIYSVSLDGKDLKKISTTGDYINVSVSPQLPKAS